MTVTVESGVLLRDLIAQAAKAGMALPSSPDWWALTVGGMISTGSHGSSLSGDGSYVHDYVVGLRIVTPASSDEGYAKVRVLDNNHPDMKAVKLSLGVLGVIAQVTLKLEPLYRRSITIVRKNDSDLATVASTFGNEHAFGEITWYPYHRKALCRIDNRVSGNGLIDFIGFHSTSTPTLEENLEETDDATVTTLELTTSGYGFTNDGNLFTGFPVGYQNRLPASGSHCLDAQTTTTCTWHPRVEGKFYHLTSVTLPLSKVKSFIQDVQNLRDIVPQAFAGLELENGILMRYIKGSNAYLGTQEDSLEFDISYNRDENALAHRRFQDVLDEVEQIAVFRYGGIPHWGKNRNIGFINVIDKYRHAREFLKVRERYDPAGVFSSKWTDQILGLDQSGVAITKEGCAMEGLCIFSEDIHCAPEEGFVCRPGRVYTDARVCRDTTEKDLGVSDI
ncbi:hypothetical protein MKW94_010777 [Papaver nudicaule]|uniref:L-gulonolactone oxidase n=1 Tax=Papaver nudicaule TaxID=74823 RepID=A0AA41V551_PAPNU|nr:hypothetical protein [Papaver nudicaule]